MKLTREILIARIIKTGYYKEIDIIDMDITDLKTIDKRLKKNA